jgi:hypothetical protein
MAWQEPIELSLSSSSWGGHPCGVEAVEIASERQDGGNICALVLPVLSEIQN